MRLDLGLQHSRLARKVLAVFLLCVLVPVIGISTVSYLQVRRQLVDQSTVRLDRDSKAVVMSVLERLILADGMMRTLTPADAEERVLRTGQGVVSPLSGALWSDGAGTALSRTGDWPRVPVATPAELQRLGEGSMLRAHPEDGKVLLARETDEGQVWATVDTTFLWSSVNEFAQLRGDGVSCILGVDARALRCDPGVSVGDVEPHLGSRAPFALTIGGREYRAVVREVYFDWFFAAPPWSVVLAEPEAAAVAPLMGFQRVFLPVAILSICIVLLFSSLQLRKIFSRLLRLQSATSRLAQGHFDEPVDMDGDDEIADLAGSFDDMSKKLGEQFAMIRATAVMDRAALEAESLPELSVRVVRGLGEMFPNSPRIALLGLASPTEKRIDGSLSVAGPTREPSEIPVSLTAEQTIKISRLNWSGMLSGDELVALVGGMGGMQLAGAFSVFPVRLDGEVHGFLAIGGDGAEVSPEQSTQVVEQVAIALSSVKRQDQLERLNWGALTALARTVDAASEWTAGHSERVADLSARLGKRLGLPDSEIERLRRGGLLHDVGKIGVPAEILEKPGKLLEDEFVKVQEHTVIGARILEPIESFADIIPLVLYHHERIDGAGYPMRVSGTAIPYGARIMAIADTFDALISDRPYRKGLGLDRALEIIESVRGTQLDAEMVDVFLEMMRESAAIREAPDHLVRSLSVEMIT